ncbi:MAG: sigma-54-dependent Fis family transcriptional regulator [Candidatus Rokubacteria bacterium]|nr:sigma-54-dependent Fis family transcriptional regulator [Candidatus Rokubacteria bacterium]
MSGTILVVDDEALPRQSVSDLLRRKGAAVDTAQDGAEALRLFLASPYPMVISDLRMPHLDGLALLREIKARVPHTFFVLLTGFGTVETAVSALKAGADDFLEKPVSPQRLQRLLERAPLTPLAEPSPRLPLTQDPRMMALFADARRAAATGATILLLGESGTGKEVLARAIHGWSPRAGGPFMALNCAALPESLVEAELFGHERGAFTDAKASHQGVIERAQGGTLLLDEIGDMPLPVQAKLLRVLEDRSVTRIGGSDARGVDVRFIAASNRSLRALVREGRFREDLLFRLTVVSFQLPPLRERLQDVPLLARHFLARYAAEYNAAVRELADSAVGRLLAHPWPGNVRELENVIQRAVILAPGPVLRGRDLVLEDATPVTPGQLAGRPWDEVEKELILSTLRQVGGNREKAAKILGMSVRTVRNRLRSYRLTEGALTLLGSPLAAAGAAS